jgi:FMN phosphatase YigB (HAD superfamily)
MRSLFLQLSLKHVMITHSARPWAQKVLAHLDLLDWFPADNILALEDFNFEFKHESQASFDAAVAQIGLPASQILFIDDTIRNLKIPAEMGMLTCYINHGRKPEELPDYVDISSNSTLTLLNTIKDLKKEDRRERQEAAS